jgi:hypothetical protein
MTGSASRVGSPSFILMHNPTPGALRRTLPFQGRDKKQAPSSPVFFAARAARRFIYFRRSRKEPRARGTPRVRGALKFTQCAQTKMLGPTGLDASRHRGLSKSCPSSRLRAATGKPQVRLTQGVPRAVFLGLLHEVPGSRAFKGMTLSLPLRTWRSGGRLLTNLRPYRPSGPSARRRTRQELRGLDRRWVDGAASPTPRPGHRSPPRVWRR